MTAVKTLLGWLDELVEAAIASDPDAARELQIRKAALRYVVLQRTSETVAARLLRQAEERRKKPDGRSQRAPASHFVTPTRAAGRRLAWKASLLSSDGIELRVLMSDAPLETIVSDVQAMIGTPIDDLRCDHVLIFGDPSQAPPDLAASFLPNWPHWQPGFHLLVGGRTVPSASEPAVYP